MTQATTQTTVQATRQTTASLTHRVGITCETVPILGSVGRDISCVELAFERSTDEQTASIASDERPQAFAKISEQLDTDLVLGLRLSPGAPAGDMVRQIQAYKPGKNGPHYVVVTPTKSTPLLAIHKIFDVRDKLGLPLVVKNHNHEHLDGGLIRAVDMAPLIASGALLCLDLCNLLWSQMAGARDESQWRERCEREFEAFLRLPIKLVHVSSVSGFVGAKSHVFSGFDIGPWVRAIANANKNAIFLANSGHPEFTMGDKIAALRGYLTAPVAEPPTAQPPVAQPPVAQPPTAQPPVLKTTTRSAEKG